MALEIYIQGRTLHLFGRNRIRGPTFLPCKNMSKIFPDLHSFMEMKIILYNNNNAFYINSNVLFFLSREVDLIRVRNPIDSFFLIFIKLI